jgi:hypothetical protein
MIKIEISDLPYEKGEKGMILRIIIGAAIIIGGLYLSFLGIVFIITSDDEAGRFDRGVMLILAGLTTGGVGIFLIREGIPVSPEAAKKKILKLAAKKKGEVPEEVIKGEVGSSETVDSQLELMISSGSVQKTVKDGRTLYIFPEFKE